MVNIDLDGFRGGILKVPENQRDGEIKVQLSETVQSVEVRKFFFVEKQYFVRQYFLANSGCSLNVPSLKETSIQTQV